MTSCNDALPTSSALLLQKLFEAAEKGDESLLEECIADLADHRDVHMNDCDESGMTALCVAIKNRQYQVVRRLLEAGASTDVHWNAPRGKSPLHIAAATGQSDVIKLLLERKSDINATDKLGSTPLHDAVFHGNLISANLLLNRRANVDVQADDGYTPLQIALEHRLLEIVQLLISHGADVNFRSKRGLPLHCAVYAGPETLARLVEKGADINGTDEDGSTSLHLASEYGLLAAAKYLIKLGADLEVRNGEEWSPLDIASKHGRLYLVKLLKEKHASITSSDEQIWSALHHAAEGGHPKVLRYLLTRGADPSDRRDGETPLELATKKGHTECVRILEAAVGAA